MAFATRLYSILPSFGVPLQNDTGYLRSGVAVSGTSTTVTLPSTSTFSPSINNGYVRVKVYNGTGTPALASISVTVTDGTTTETIGSFNPPSADAPALSTTIWGDVIFPFLSELSCNNCSVVIRLTTPGGAKADVEIDGAAGSTAT